MTTNTTNCEACGSNNIETDADGDLLEHYIHGSGSLVCHPRLTAETITDDQIEQLRADAAAAGDDRQVDYCSIALSRWETQDIDDDGGVIDLVWPWNGQPAKRSHARQVCADVINNARAQEVE